jgi:hypothetical protein
VIKCLFRIVEEEAISENPNIDKIIVIKQCISFEEQYSSQWQKVCDLKNIRHISSYHFPLTYCKLAIMLIMKFSHHLGDIRKSYSWGTKEEYERNISKLLDSGLDPHIVEPEVIVISK